MSKAFRKHKEQASTAIIQPCDTVLYQLLEKSQDNTYASELMLRQATRLANKTGSLAKLEDGQKSLHSAQSELDTIKGLLDPECRVFGHVLYGAGLKVKEDKEKFRWIPDWALVGLEAEKHHTDLPNLQNRIHLTDSNATKLAGFFRKGKGANVDRGPPFDGSRYYLSLGGTVPASELWKAEVPPLIVGKVGAKTGTTFGIANAVKSVTRNACADLPCLRDQICEEWCIIGMEDESGHQVPFSSNGDSGACVWTMDGRIAGIIAAGNGTGKIQDVTYAMIWERLAEDIVDHGYEISSFPAKED
jgi:hypothetical protein